MTEETVAKICLWFVGTLALANIVIYSMCGYLQIKIEALKRKRK